MSRSRRKQPRKPVWELRDDGCLPEERRRTYHRHRDLVEPPTAAEQLASMCDCPNCRVGKEDRCYASAATETGQDCTVCGGPCRGAETVLSEPFAREMSDDAHAAELDVRTALFHHGDAATMDKKHFPKAESSSNGEPHE